MFRTIIACGLLCVAAPSTATGPGGDFVRIAPDAVAWKDVPGSPGVRMAVLYGDPAKPGLYIVRARFPPHVMDLPHFHPKARIVTVVEGTWYTGTGTKFDPAKAVPLPAGSVMIHPAGAPHWDGSATDEAVVVQIVGEGPGTSTAVDPKAPDWVTLPR